MSNYYDINKPYSITNWNDLVRDVNDILENPPGEGPGCDPIEPIEEVEDPHIWAVEDVEEVREKLLETCSTLTFDEELEIWKPEIIDEIEDAMEDAWCDCEPEDPEPVVTSCGGFDQNIISAGRSEEICCDNEELGAVCGVCEYCHRNTWRGPWYPSTYASNQDILDGMGDSFNEASGATFAFIHALNNMMTHAANIDEWQGYVDFYVSNVDAGIAFWNANCDKTPPEVDDPTCPTVAASIQTNGEGARTWQDKVDEEITNWQEDYDTAMAKLEEADTAASNNWSGALSLDPRYPDDVNHISECFDSVVSSGLDWYKWWNPYRGNAPSLPEVRVWYENETKWGAGVKASITGIKISPNGTPFSTSSFGSRYGRSRYSLTYYENKFEIRTALGGCVWTLVHDFVKIYYIDLEWAIFAPLPEPDPADYGTYEPYIEVTKPAGSTKDWTQEQDEWYATYQNWYDEHPQYDDRHEDY